MFSKKLNRSIALDTLFNAHSYRIPNNLNKYKAPLVYMMKSLRILFSKNIILPNFYIQEKAMYCMANQHAETCVKYATNLGMNTQQMNVIIRDVPFVSNLSLLEKMIMVFFNSVLCVFSLVTTLFKRQISNISILPVELTENTILLNNLLQYKTSYLYYFSAFEKDANFTALLMKDNNIYCHKIPSSNPIKNFYSKVIADKFSFTAPFQINEYPSLSKNWCVNDFDLYPNFGFQNLTNMVIEKKGSAPKNSLGIFTRGIWLRKLRGDSFLGVGEDAAEFAMLDSVKEFLKSNLHINVVYILLHPTEKKTEEQYEKTKQYYTQFFSGIEIIFADQKLPSYSLFNLFEVGVASLSSVIFERLHCGYKCMLSPIDLKVKLYEDPNLENIIAYSKGEFFVKLKEIFTYTDKDYFINYNLKDYRLLTINSINIQ